MPQGQKKENVKTGKKKKRWRRRVGDVTPHKWDVLKKCAFFRIFASFIFIFTCEFIAVFLSH